MTDQISPNNGGRGKVRVEELTADPLLACSPFRTVLITRHGRTYLTPHDALELAEELRTVAERVRNELKSRISQGENHEQESQS